MTDTSSRVCTRRRCSFTTSTPQFAFRGRNQAGADRWTSIERCRHLPEQALVGFDGWEVPPPLRWQEVKPSECLEEESP